MHLYGHSSETSVYVKLILNDNYAEIVKDLLQIYKKSKKDYIKVT